MHLVNTYLSYKALLHSVFKVGMLRHYSASLVRVKHMNVEWEAFLFRL